jgi:hypothetical protein
LVPAKLRDFVVRRLDMTIVGQSPDVDYQAVNNRYITGAAAR